MQHLKIDLALKEVSPEEEEIPTAFFAFRARLVLKDEVGTQMACHGELEIS